MNSVSPPHRLRTPLFYFPHLPKLAGTVLHATLLSCLAVKADVIYRETFGIPPTATVDTNATIFDWQRFDNNGAIIGGPAVNFSAVGRLADVSNVNAGPNDDGTFAAYTNGIFYMAATPSPSVGLTTEFSFDPTNYAAGSVVFSWYEGNNTAP